MISGKIIFLFAVAVVAISMSQVDGNPAIEYKHRRLKHSNHYHIDLMGGYDFLGVCLRNCAQCKKMYGSYFEGPMCAEACVKFKGKIIPDCEDIGSIAPFLNKFN